MITLIKGISQDPGAYHELLHKLVPPFEDVLFLLPAAKWALEVNTGVRKGGKGLSDGDVIRTTRKLLVGFNLMDFDMCTYTDCECGVQVRSTLRTDDLTDDRSALQSDVYSHRQ